MNKIIFLDVDGVLNWQETWQGPHKDSCSTLDPDCCDELKRIVKATKATIVLSSTWRLSFPDGRNAIKLKDWLSDRGLTIHSLTPNLWDEYGTVMCRGHEIKRWLDGHKTEFPDPQFVILDDDNDMNPDQQEFFVQTSFQNGGLTPELADKAIEILNTRG
jgi:hypothetical protein